MSGDDEIIIRNGSLKEWGEYALLKYFITFGARKYRAAYVVAAALGISFLAGAVVF